MASVFCPVVSNLMPFHGMIVWSPGTSVLVSATRMSSGLLDPARSIASASTWIATIWREVLSFRSLFAFARYIALTAGIAGRDLSASSAKLLRLMAPSASGPAAVMKDCSWKPAACARIAGW